MAVIKFFLKLLNPIRLIGLIITVVGSIGGLMLAVTIIDNTVGWQRELLPVRNLCVNVFYGSLRRVSPLVNKANDALSGVEQVVVRHAEQPKRRIKRVYVRPAPSIFSWFMGRGSQPQEQQQEQVQGIGWLQWAEINLKSAIHITVYLAVSVVIGWVAIKIYKWYYHV